MKIKQNHLAVLEQGGVTFEVPPRHFIESGWTKGSGRALEVAMDADPEIAMALDAQPTVVTTANAGIPSALTMFIDPDALRILQSPNEAANIFGEESKGSWTDVQGQFPVIENTGTVSAYGDYSMAGRSDINATWEQREFFLFQSIIGYGDLETARAALGKINLVSEKQQAMAKAIDKYKNRSYFLGISGLANYGLLNDPSLLPAIAPAIKANGGSRWVVGSTINATANEVFNDVQSLVLLVIKQAGGLLNTKSKFTLAMSPQSDGALMATNSFGKTALEMIARAFPNLTVKTAVQYGALSASNVEGNASGEMMQLIADDVEGQDTGYCMTNATLRMGRIVPSLSAFEQKAMAGTGGALVRQPFGIATMIGL